MSEQQPPEEEADRLPEDLDVTGYVGPYTFPDVKRRRYPGVLYAVAGFVALWLWWFLRHDTPLVNGGVGAAGLVLLGLASYHFSAAWPLQVDATDALARAGSQAGFPVGHASAQLGWRGLVSRPTWRILLYSADDPPSKRGFVLVDAVEGQVVGSHVEDNPEDWSQFGQKPQRG